MILKPSFFSGRRIRPRWRRDASAEGFCCYKCGKVWQPVAITGIDAELAEKESTSSMCVDCGPQAREAQAVSRARADRVRVNASTREADPIGDLIEDLRREDLALAGEGA